MKNNLLKELQKRNLPSLFTPNGEWNGQRRSEALNILKENLFGCRPPEPVRIEFKEYSLDECSSAIENGIYGHDEELYNYFKSSDKAVFKKVRVICYLSIDDFPGLKVYPQLGGKFEFDINCYMPEITEGEKLPALAAATYREAFDGLPARDIIEKGVAVFAYNYRQLVNDYPERHGERRRPQYDNDGLDRLYYGDYRLRDNPSSRKGDEPGTIAFWSWGVSRVMDYVQTQGAYINLDKVAVSGHSRLAKTALFTGACDERFTHILSNASCAAGAALSRGCDKKEDLKYMAEAFPEWLCENLKTSYDSPLFDMHFLLACIAPRKICIVNADNDAYCDQDSEYLSCVAASEVYERLGYKGFIHPDRLPATGDKFHDGDIGYSLRAGAHTFPLEDWLVMLEFFLKF